VPADRFFRAAPQVRAAIEAQVTANALLHVHETDFIVIEPER
jgi:hypothetical protein